MEEKEVEKCNCKEGFHKGAIKKNFEFENFSIFGNLMQKNTVVIRYLKNSNQITPQGNILLYYVMDNNWENIQKIKLAPCEFDKKCICATIDLKSHLNISLGFYTEGHEENISAANSYTFKIASNTIDDVMRRFGDEENTMLPVAKTDEVKMSSVSKLYAKIKLYITSIFNKLERVKN